MIETCLVVGANRGIGLALVQALLADQTVVRTIATYRQGADIQSLVDLAGSHGERLELRVLDFENEDSLQAFSDYIAGQPGNFDLAIHAAGILHERGIKPEKTLTQCHAANLKRLFEVNSIGPLMVAKALLTTQARNHRFTFAALSAMVGSIEDNRLGGWYGYRASKTALNQFIRTLAVECRVRFPQASIVAIHPGTTDTELSRPFQRSVPPGKLYRPDQTAERILSVIRSINHEQSGQFLNWNADQIPW